MPPNRRRRSQCEHYKSTRIDHYKKETETLPPLRDDDVSSLTSDEDEYHPDDRYDSEPGSSDPEELSEFEDDEFDANGPVRPTSGPHTFWQGQYLAHSEFVDEESEVVHPDHDQDHDSDSQSDHDGSSHDRSYDADFETDSDEVYDDDDESALGPPSSVCSSAEPLLSPTSVSIDPDNLSLPRFCLFPTSSNASDAFDDLYSNLSSSEEDILTAVDPSSPHDDSDWGSLLDPSTEPDVGWEYEWAFVSSESSFSD